MAGRIAARLVGAMLMSSPVALSGMTVAAAQRPDLDQYAGPVVMCAVESVAAVAGMTADVDRFSCKRRERWLSIDDEVADKDKLQEFSRRLIANDGRARACLVRRMEFTGNLATKNLTGQSPFNARLALDLDDCIKAGNFVRIAVPETTQEARTLLMFTMDVMNEHLEYVEDELAKAACRVLIEADDPGAKTCPPLNE